MIDLTWHVNLALSDSSIPRTAQMVSSCKALLLFLSDLVVRIFCILTWSGVRAMADWQQGEGQNSYGSINSGKRGWFLLSSYRCASTCCQKEDPVVDHGLLWLKQRHWHKERHHHEWERVVQWLSRSWWKVGGKRSWESHLCKSNGKAKRRMKGHQGKGCDKSIWSLLCQQSAVVR